ncbi:Wd Repeat-Containing Protein 43 [Manis pentadactyla]|nr:Wd Repeat-Containing Protein 43 [Manis pentadactyla]
MTIWEFNFFSWMCKAYSREEFSGPITATSRRYRLLEWNIVTCQKWRHHTQSIQLLVCFSKVKRMVWAIFAAMSRARITGQINTKVMTLTS